MMMTMMVAMMIDDSGGGSDDGDDDDDNGDGDGIFLFDRLVRGRRLPSVCSNSTRAPTMCDAHAHGERTIRRLALALLINRIT